MRRSCRSALKTGPLAVRPAITIPAFIESALTLHRAPADAIDPLSTATQLEATIALVEWQRQRHLPPGRRIVGLDHSDIGYEATLDVVGAIMRAR